MGEFRTIYRERGTDGRREKHSFSFPFRSFGGGKISLPLLLLRFYLAAAAAAAARMPDMSFSLAAHMEEEGKPHKHSPCFSLKKKDTSNGALEFNRDVYQVPPIVMQLNFNTVFVPI